MRNRVSILDAVREGKNSFSKKEIAQATKIPWGTVCKCVDSLLKEEHLFIRRFEPTKRGRPMIPMGIDPDSAFFAGFDVGASSTRLVFCDLLFNVKYRHEIRTPYYKNNSAFFKWVLKMFSDSLKEAGIDKKKLMGIGFSMSGNVDTERGILVSGRNWGVKWGANIPVADILSEHTGIPVFAVPATAAGVLAEYHFGKWKGYSNIVTVGLGAGIGSGIISNGELLITQPHRPIGYIGHMLIPDNNHICSCGFKGCLESYSGGIYLPLIGKEEIPEQPELHSAAALDLAAASGHAKAVAIMKKAASYNAVGIASMIQLYGPDVLIFYGGQCKKDGFLFNQTLKHVREVLPQERLNLFEIGLTTLGDYQAAMGAARLAYERFF